MSWSHMDTPWLDRLRSIETIGLVEFNLVCQAAFRQRGERPIASARCLGLVGEESRGEVGGAIQFFCILTTCFDMDCWAN